MFSLRALLVALLGFSLPQVYAATQQELIPRISELIAPQQHMNTPGMLTVKIKMLSPKEQLANLCETPEFRLSGHPARLTGNRSIIARCGNRQTFLQVNISATGTYWTATQTLTPGTLISRADIQPQRGELDGLSDNILLDPAKIVGTTPTRIIRVGQVLDSDQLRKSRVIRAGNEVDIVAPGNGFLIHAKGKALDSAGLNERLRIQTHTGQIVRVTATGNNKATINLQD
ncbi:Flagella basal body P-ring formation protein FlgA precursor [Enterobacter sp. DC4]|uniref:flagellar basal body P-ring formation chaperone FlgA n=1 Tax=Enterobacter sp. DC4 TaxID=1395580 RepID=UPI0003ED13FE|nr:flagellar basal body P-ring formation chaperone FlgA [Enterobacter sp. DC4]EWG67281.1 Flagella basal body P-ring formation protein FlgA precursor [Enterobacter sp. DC4]